MRINYLWLYKKVSGLMANYMNNWLEHVQNFPKLWVIAFVDPSLRHQLQWLDQDDTRSLVSTEAACVKSSFYNIAL